MIYLEKKFTFYNLYRAKLCYVKVVMKKLPEFTNIKRKEILADSQSSKSQLYKAENFINN